MTTYATLVDPLNTPGSVDFIMDGNFQQTVHEVGQLWYPLGLGYATKSSDGSKGLGGILIITTTSDAQNALVRVLMQTNTPLTLTLPNGDSYSIMWDPAMDRKFTQQFSLMAQDGNVPPIGNWTATFVQAA